MILLPFSLHLGVISVGWQSENENENDDDDCKICSKAITLGKHRDSNKYKNCNSLLFIFALSSDLTYSFS